MNKEVYAIIKKVNNNKTLRKISMFMLGVFILSLNYNVFVLPNKFNIGGTSGLAIMFKELCNINPTTFIFISAVVLLILSSFILDKKQAVRGVIGALLYPIMINLTVPLSELIIPSVQFSNELITIILCGSLIGLGNGLVYKAGYTTGGGDIMMKIVSKYHQITEGNASLLINTIIVGLGLLVFGFTSVIYSILLIVISTYLVDKILIGISDSKMFMIYSKKSNIIKEYVLNTMNTGVTIFKTEGGFLKVSRKMLMVVVSTRDYYHFKEAILEIDPDAFFVINDCYEVSGGIKRKNFLD